MKRDSNHINSFFIEIIIVIGFFAISAAVTLQLFAKAGNRTRQSSDLSAAVIQAQNIVEQIRGLSSEEEVPESLKAAEHTGSDNSQNFRLNYDKHWNRTERSPYYGIDVAVTKNNAASGTMVHADITVYRFRSDAENKILMMTADKYLPKTP